MFKLLLQIIGVAFFLLGLILMVAPTPFGFVLVAIGASLVIANNKKVASWVRNLRTRSKAVDSFFDAIQHVLPGHWRDGLDQTDPDGTNNKKTPPDD